MRLVRWLLFSLLALPGMAAAQECVTCRSEACAREKDLADWCGKGADPLAAPKAKPPRVSRPLEVKTPQAPPLVAPVVPRQPAPQTPPALPAGKTPDGVTSLGEAQSPGEVTPPEAAEGKTSDGVIPPGGTKPPGWFIPQEEKTPSGVMPTAAPPRWLAPWKWTTLALGLAAGGAGAALFALDGNPTCPAVDGRFECPKILSTQPWGYLAISAGAAGLVSATVFFILDARPHQRPPAPQARGVRTTPWIVVQHQ